MVSKTLQNNFDRFSRDIFPKLKVKENIFINCWTGSAYVEKVFLRVTDKENHNKLMRSLIGEALVETK